MLLGSSMSRAEVLLAYVTGLWEEIVASTPPARASYVVKFHGNTTYKRELTG